MSAAKSPPKPPKKPQNQAQSKLESNSKSELMAPQISVEAKLIDADLAGYCPIRADFIVPKSSKVALKRLALTLDVTEARLKDGTLVQNRVSRAVAWLVEQFADEIAKSESGRPED